MAIIGVEPDKWGYRASEQLLLAISKKLGITIELIPLPAKRATLWLKNGKIHGELGRLAIYSEVVPSAIKVPEPIITLPYYAYTNITGFMFTGLDSLKGHRIVTIRGFALANIILKDFETYQVASMMDAFEFIKANRAEFFIGNPMFAEEILNDKAFYPAGIRRLEPPVATWSSYTFFSGAFPQLAEDYHHALVELKDSGRYQKILADTK